MSDTNQKEYTFTLGQIALFITAVLLPGVGAYYTLRQEVAELKEWKATHTLYAEKLEGKVDAANEKLTDVRLELARWAPQQAQAKPAKNE